MENERQEGTLNTESGGVMSVRIPRVWWPVLVVASPDRRAARHAARLGCQWNREPLQLLQQAGLEVRQARRTLFGIFHVIVAAPRSHALLGLGFTVSHVFGGRIGA